MSRKSVSDAVPGKSSNRKIVFKVLGGVAAAWTVSQGLFQRKQFRLKVAKEAVIRAKGVKA